MICHSKRGPAGRAWVTNDFGEYMIESITTGAHFKRFGHKIVGNFSTYQLVCHWINGSTMTIMTLKLISCRTLKKCRETKKGNAWTKLKRILLDCNWVNLKTLMAHFCFCFCFVFFFIFLSLVWNVRNARKASLFVMRPWFSSNTVSLRSWSLELLINEYRQNYLEWSDQAPLNCEWLW